MLKDKSLRELETIFQQLNAKLEKINQNAIRDKKYDFEVMPWRDLEQVLRSENKLKEKTQLLLTQIGYLRINLFTECYEQVQRAQTNNELDKTVNLMDRYAEEIVIPFVPTKKQPAISKRLKELLTKKTQPEPTECIQKWRTAHETWLKQIKPTNPPTNNENRTEEYNQLKMAFMTLYTFSFSADDFPPLRSRRTDH